MSRSKIKAELDFQETEQHILLVLRQNLHFNYDSKVPKPRAWPSTNNTSSCTTNS